MHKHTHAVVGRFTQTGWTKKYKKKKKERKIEILYLLDRLLVTGHICGCYQIALPSMANRYDEHGLPFALSVEAGR